MTLELASNKYLETILNQRLFTAMEIDASFSSGGVKSTDQLVTLYRSDGSVARSVNYQKSLRRTGSPGSDGTFFAGGLTISSRDMGKMIALLTQDGRFEGVQMMDEESVKLMESYSQQKVSTGFYQAMPMRYQENMYGREGLYFHTGSAYGVYNAYSYDPITGDGVVVLTTGAIGYKDKYGIYSVCADISKYIYNTIK
jgi:CubicO group peptidase (beta-lactamase class C family)